MNTWPIDCQYLVDGSVILPKFYHLNQTLSFYCYYIIIIIVIHNLRVIHHIRLIQVGSKKAISNLGVNMLMHLHKHLFSFQSKSISLCFRPLHLCMFSNIIGINPILKPVNQKNVPYLLLYWFGNWMWWICIIPVLQYNHSKINLPHYQYHNLNT